MSKIYTLKITLEQSSPPIWRRIQVRADLSFLELHNIIQIAMDWENKHMFSFEFKTVSVGMQDEFGALPGLPMQVSAEYTSLIDLFSKEKKCRYLYDFGDDWSHAIKVEGIQDAPTEDFFAACVAGKRRCPPEDCGGIFGYYQFLETISNPDDPEYEEMRGWLMGYDADPDEVYDTEYFDLSEVNDELAQYRQFLLEDGEEYDDGEEYGVDELGIDFPLEELMNDDNDDVIEELPPPSMEQWRRLYALAKKIQDISPWYQCHDGDYIAIQPTGYEEPIFFAPVGALGEVFGLMAYPGKTALGSIEALRGRMSTCAVPFTGMGRQECIAIHFGDREDVTKEDRAIMTELGLKFRGRGKWIYFRSVQPGYDQWRINEKEATMLLDCLEQYLNVMTSITTLMPSGPDWEDSFIHSVQIEGCDNEWDTRVSPLTAIDRLMLTISLTDDLLLARLKKLKRSDGDWEADAFYVPVPVSKEDCRPKLLPMAVLVDRDNEVVLKVAMRRQKGDCTEELLMDTLTQAIIDHGKPKNLFVYCADMAFAASDLCKQLGIQLHMDEEMGMMDEVLGDLFSQLMISMME